MTKGITVLCIEILVLVSVIMFLSGCIAPNTPAATPTPTPDATPTPTPDATPTPTPKETPTPANNTTDTNTTENDTGAAGQPDYYGSSSGGSSGSSTPHTPIPETATAIMAGIGIITAGLLIYRTRGR